MITSAPSFTTEGSGDGVRRIRTRLSRHYQRKQMECKGVVVFLQAILIIRHRFRWEFCHIDQDIDLLRHCFSPSVRRILEELPESLDETYERILRDIRRPNQGHARRLLQCLVVAIHPLRVEELAEVLAFDFETEGPGSRS